MHHYTTLNSGHYIILNNILELNHLYAHSIYVHLKDLSKWKKGFFIDLSEKGNADKFNANNFVSITSRTLCKKCCAGSSCRIKLSAIYDNDKIIMHLVEIMTKQR